MLRCRHTIRLSPVDLRLFVALTGADQAAPTTVQDYNQRLRAAARRWARAASREERQLGEIARRLLLDEGDDSSVIEHPMLAPG